MGERRIVLRPLPAGTDIFWAGCKGHFSPRTCRGIDLPDRLGEHECGSNYILFILHPASKLPGNQFLQVAMETVRIAMILWCSQSNHNPKKLPFVEFKDQFLMPLFHTYYFQYFHYRALGVWEHGRRERVESSHHFCTLNLYHSMLGFTGGVSKAGVPSKRASCWQAAVNASLTSSQVTLDQLGLSVTFAGHVSALSTRNLTQSDMLIARGWRDLKGSEG